MAAGATSCKAVRIAEARCSSGSSTKIRPSLELAGFMIADSKTRHALVVPRRRVEPYEGLLLGKCKVFLRAHWSGVALRCPRTPQRGVPTRQQRLRLRFGLRQCSAAFHLNLTGRKRLFRA